MEISTCSENSKIMVSNNNVMKTTPDIRVGGKTLEEMKTIQHIRSTLNEGLLQM